MNVRKLGMDSGDEASGGVKFAFVPVSVNISHPLDLAICAVLAVAWRAVSRLREVRAGAVEMVASGVPGAVVVSAAIDGSEASCLETALDRLDALYLERAGDLSRESSAPAAEQAVNCPLTGRVV